MSRKKTNKEFTEEVYKLVGDEYVFLQEYINSSQSILVKHIDCGSKYLVTPSNFLAGTKCPYCIGYKVNHTNSLAVLRPDIARIWHPTKNGELTPHDVTCGNTRLKIWWLCENNHETCSPILNRTNGHRCAYCAGKEATLENCLATLNPELASEWHPSKNGDLTPQDVLSGSDKVVWWICKLGHEYDLKIDSKIRKKQGCPYCANKRILIGFNDMWTTNPELASLLFNPEDGYKYTKSSAVKLDWKCLKCNTIIRSKRISSINNQGLSCHGCSDGVSYPEKLLSNLLKQLGVDFFFQKVFNWSERKTYDFYIEYKDINIIIETHGGQHYDKGFESVGGRTLAEEQGNDSYKYGMAMESNIDKYIIIDCRKSELEFIKTNILNSELNELFDLTNINWEKIHEESLCSLLLKSSELWNIGWSTTQIKDELKLSRDTIIRYLNTASELLLCNYDKKESLRRGNLIAKNNRLLRKSNLISK